MSRIGPIAIVGIGCRFAGAEDLQAYWRMMLDGRHGFGRVPADRWDASAFESESRRAADKSYTSVGAFIDDIKTFPALALKVPPRRVEVMDPQHRFALECALQAIHDAGYSPEALPHRTGVFLGVTASEYSKLMGARIVAQMAATGAYGEPPEDPSVLAKAVERVSPPRPYSASGSLANMTAATVAQELDLHGPAYSVDSACASALVAIHDAVTQLRAGQIDSALAGGVYLQITPDHYVAFSRVGAMSAQGVCRPFDARADGFVQGDGAGVLLLKRLEDAQRDGDRVYAVLRGIAANSDGRGSGPMAPVKAGQTECIRLALEDGGVDPSEIGYLEAHGTGTPVGDPTEVEGATDAYGTDGARVALGSSKANVGHTMSAAGVAGLIRATLAVHHRTIPPIASFESPNPKLDLSTGRFFVPTSPIAWDESAGRLAGVSSFGFGGTNVHAIVEPAPEPALGTEAREQSELVLLSAGDMASLQRFAARVAETVETQPQLSVAAVAKALGARMALKARAAFPARTRQELLAGLKAVAEGGLPEDGHLGEADGEAKKIAFLFPGQGAQRPGMLSQIIERFPVVGETLARLEEGLERDLPIPLTHLLYPERRAKKVDPGTARAQLTQTSNCQPALLACGVALAKLLDALGVRPEVVTGHSLGEFTAAAVAGVLSEGDAARFVCQRGQAMEALGGDTGAMAALRVDAETAAKVVDGVEGAVIANFNHPKQVVVSGLSEAVREVVDKASAAGIDAVPLEVSHGFHSPALEGLDVAPLLEKVAFSDPQITVATGIESAPYRDGAHAKAVFTKHALSPVDFVGALRQCDEAGADIYLQVGAGGPLASFARGTLRGKPAFSLASMRDEEGVLSLMSALARLFTLGVDLNLSAIVGDAPLASLPASVLPREPYWAISDRTFGLQLEAGSAPQKAARSEPAKRAPAAPEAATSGDALADTVIAVVAKVSAYPKAAVKPGMLLMEQLGFDSLMVGDLVAGLGEKFPGLEGIPQELLINNPSVADIIDYVRTVESGGAAESEDRSGPLQRWQPVWAPAPADDLPKLPLTVKGLRVLLVGREDGVSALCRNLQGKGAKLQTIGNAHIDKVAEADGADLILWAADTQAPRPIGSIISGEVEWPDQSGALIAALDRQAALGERPGVLVVRRDDDPWSEGLAGVVRTVAREWPGVVAKTVAFDESVGLESRRKALWVELVSADRGTDVRYTAEGREALRFEPAKTGGGRPLGADDVVMITGGTRGIGAKIAHELAGRGARLVLVGRSKPSAGIQALIERSAGRVVFAQADVCDRKALKDAIATTGWQVSALVHSAGILADGAIGSVSPERGELARKIKTCGFLNAMAACGHGLERAVGLGSWAGRFGNRHQAHYAAANALMAGLAAHAPNGTRAVVSEFGPWSSTDMAQTIPEAVKKAMRAEGVDFVEDDEGIACVLSDLEQAEAASVVTHARRQPLVTHRLLEDNLSLGTHPYLADHAIDGHPVLPLAGATDLLAWTAGVEAPFEVRDLRLFQGVVVDEPLDVHGAVVGDKAELKIGEEAKLAYRAKVRRLDALTPRDVAPSRGGDKPTLALSDFYDVTFHGPMLAGITAIDEVGKTFVRGKVKVGAPRDWMPATRRKAWAVDPLVLDSAFQLAAYVAWTRWERAGTPVKLGRYVAVRPLPEAGTEIVAECRFAEDAGEGDRFAADVFLWTTSGELLAWVEDVVAELRQADKAEADDDAADADDTGADDFEFDPAWAAHVDPAQWPAAKDMKMRLQMAEASGIGNPYFHVHEGTARDTTVTGGQELIHFSGYNYLGYSGDERVIKDVVAAIQKFGTSVSASRVASGERPFHGALEKKLAACQGADDAVLFTAGHAANVSTIGHVMGPEDLVLHDELIHDSILGGIKMSHAARRGFRHEDFDHLEQQLRDLRRHYKKVLIVVEGVYSMDGDVADVPRLIDLKKRYGCLLMIDEAHSFGVIGATGQGIREHFGIDGADVDIWMGTLSKTLSSCGGWIAGSQDLIDYLRYTVGGFIFSAGMTPANGQAALSALDLMLEEPERVAKLQHNCRFFYDRCVALGLDTGPSVGQSAVAPVITGNSLHAMELSRRLKAEGINVNPIVFPAVADDAARLRFFLSSLHSDAQLDEAATKTARILGEIRAEDEVKAAERKARAAARKAQTGKAGGKRT